MFDFCNSLDGHINTLKVDKFEAEDVSPVVHAVWEKAERRGSLSYDEKSFRQCSHCKSPIYLWMTMKFCPNCGAKMMEVIK